MFDALKRLWNDEDGLTTIEYALLLAVLAVAYMYAWGGNTASNRVGGTIAIGT